MGVGGERGKNKDWLESINNRYNEDCICIISDSNLLLFISEMHKFIHNYVTLTFDLDLGST